MASANNEQESSTWFADVLGDRSNIGDQLQEIKAFAYAAFDKIDKNANGFLSHDELESAAAGTEVTEKERSFLNFLIDNHDEISEACDEGEGSEGISRTDLDNYFELISSLL